MSVIGVLALQGDFAAHRLRLEELGASAVLVKKIGQLAHLDGLIIPGGESTAVTRLLGEDGFDALRQFVRTKPTFGTCAGAILLASEVEPSSQPTLGAIDMRIRRNAYGRQVDSSIAHGVVAGAPTEMVFIRAPKITRVGPLVRVLGKLDGDPVAVKQGQALAATFHPELSADTRLHQIFLEMVEGGKTIEEGRLVGES